MQYGLGIRQVGDWIGHEGTMLGNNSAVFHLPATRTTVVVMANAAGASEPATDLWGQIVTLLHPGSLPHWNG